MDKEPVFEEKLASSPKMMYIIVALMAVLLLFATVQTFQINTLEKRVATGNVVVSGTAAAPAPAAPQAAPAMVGGC